MIKNNRSLFLFFFIILFFTIFFFNNLIKREKIKMKAEISSISEKLETLLQSNQEEVINGNNQIEKEIIFRSIDNDIIKENFNEEESLENDFINNDFNNKDKLKNETENNIKRINNLEIIRNQSDSFLKIISSESLENRELVKPETFLKLKESGISRYFLSGVKLIDNSYIPMIHACLHRENYPSYIYHTWSSINYPEYTPEIALIKYRLLPEDNDNFKPNSSCYLREIITENDLRNVEQVYGFYENLFN
jgi:hypothetical protein